MFKKIAFFFTFLSFLIIQGHDVLAHHHHESETSAMHFEHGHDHDLFSNIGIEEDYAFPNTHYKYIEEFTIIEFIPKSFKLFYCPVHFFRDHPPPSPDIPNRLFRGPPIFCVDTI